MYPVTGAIPLARLGRATLCNSAWYLDQLITFLAIGEDTHGQFALLRVRGIRGGGLPDHVHEEEDETIYLLEGELSVSTCGELIHASPGDTVTIPRGVEHTIHHGTAEVLFLVQFTPAG